MDGERFTVRLNRLFETVRNDEGKTFTIAEIVRRMNAAGYRITDGYITQLRKGYRSRPSMVVIEGLAVAFSVPAAYFFDEYDGRSPTDADSDTDLPLLVMRTAQLSKEGRRQVLMLINEIRQREARRSNREG